MSGKATGAVAVPLQPPQLGLEGAPIASPASAAARVASRDSSSCLPHS